MKEFEKYTKNKAKKWKKPKKKEKSGNMENISMYILPVLVIALLIFARIKKIGTYDSFVKGAKSSFDLVVSIFPFLVAIMVCVALFRASGLSDLCVKLVSPIFNFLGIPSEICELVLLRPFTGSGSLALLGDILKTYGPDSYVARCACCILGSSETVFYVSTVYFSKTSVKKLGVAIPIALFASLVSAIVSCLFCKIL